MTLRAEALEFQPEASAQLTLGDLLIQKLADSIISMPPTITRIDAGPFPELDTIAQELPAAGIFCPWCTARLQCAFHLPKHRSREALKTEDVRSNFVRSRRDRMGVLPHYGCQSPKDPFSHVREECAAPKAYRNDDVKALKSDMLHRAVKMSTSEWLNNATPSIQVWDDETVTTALSCEETSYAESEDSESSSPNENTHEEKHTRNIP